MLARFVVFSMTTLGMLGTINALDANTKPEPTIAGTWDSTYGNVQITQQGNRVSGQYPCCGGGTFKGRVVDGFVKFHWSEPRGAGEGEGVWRIKKDGSLEGSWGRGQSDTDGGEWNLWRSRQIAQ